MRSTLITIGALLVAMLPGAEHLPETPKRSASAYAAETGRLLQDETQPPANAGTGTPIYGEAISRTQTVVNEAGSIPEYGEMLTRGITVVNEAGSIPSYGEMLTRGITVVNEAGSIPEYGEMISRAMTVCNEAGGPPGCPLDCLADSDCDDANVCTEDTCVANLCAHAPIANACDDGDFCTVNDACFEGTCVGDENPECCSPARFTEHVISTSAFGAVSVFATDVDGDGDIDVLSASRDDNQITWYESDGGSPPTFTEHLISTTAILAFSVFATDLDGDGDADVLSASRGIDEIAWYENDGGSPPTFTTRVISTNANAARSVFAIDVDGDGNTDVLSASRNDHKIAWYQSDGGSPPTFTERMISTDAMGARSVFAIDVDGDGDIDVLSASRVDNKIAWYDSDGGTPPTFTERMISNTALDASSVFAADLDGDGDIDALSASFVDNKIAWYQSDGGSPPTFTERVISTTAFDAISVFAADVDGDGDTDVLSASQFDDKIAWYENDGGSPPTFTERVISTAASEAVSVFATDLDGDGDTDLLSASQLDGKIAWYENTPVSCCTPSWDVTIGTPGLTGINDHVRTLLGVGNHPSVETGLYAGGNIEVVGGVDANGIARWDGLAWSPLLHNGDPAANGVGTEDVSVNADVIAMAIFNGALYVGGQFTTAGGQAASRIARWDGTSWQPLLHNNDPSFNGLDDEVWSLFVFDDGTGQALYVGGKFNGAGIGCPDGPGCLPLPLGQIAKWDGNAWSDVGGGFLGVSSEYVASMAEYNDDEDAVLYVGGKALIPVGLGGGHPLVKWNGLTWATVDPGLAQPNSTPEVRSLAVFDDGTGQGLYAGGIFTKGGEQEVNRVARWNGSEWSDLAGGLDDSVFELGVFDDGTGPDLYAGGFFAGTADGSVAANRIAKWNGTSWSPLGTGVNNSIWAFTTFNDGADESADLFVGGKFSQADGEIARGIAKWTGCPPCGGVADCGDGCCAAAETNVSCPQDCACDIAPAEDCFEVLGSNSAIDFRNFPIPADTFGFGPGAPAFDGVVQLRNASKKPFTLSWDRSNLANACTGAPIALQVLKNIVLNDVNPFIVRDENGNPKFWEMTVILIPAASPPGTMSITRTHDNGGTFTAEFSVNVVLWLSPSVQPPAPDGPIIKPFDLSAQGFGPFRLRTTGPVSFVDNWVQTPPGAPCDVNFNPGVREDPLTEIQCCETFLMAGSGLYLELRQPDCVDACATGACCLPNELDPADQCDDTITDSIACTSAGGSWQEAWPNCDDDDGDGWANWRETVRSRFISEVCHTETDPTDPDTDNDGCLDGVDPNPLDPCNPPGGCSFGDEYEDCNGNGEPDACDIQSSFYDCDNNGIVDDCTPDLDTIVGVCCNGLLGCGDVGTKPECEAAGFAWRGACLKCPLSGGKSEILRGVVCRHFPNSSGPLCVCSPSPPPPGCNARAACIPGDKLDAWKTEPGQDMCHQFGVDPIDCPANCAGGNCSPPIPADFFGPGSDPFASPVCLEGVPLGGGFGDADTVVKRSADPFDRCTLPSPTEIIVDIDAVELSLKSIDPITVTFNGGQTNELWDVIVTLSEVAAPTGSLTAIKEHCNGGTYTSELFILPKFTFTRQGGGKALQLDTGLAGICPVTLTQTGADTEEWVHEVDPGLSIFSPNCTEFHPAIEDLDPLPACDCNANLTRDKCDIEQGASLDCNGDGIPDECQLASNDCNNNGVPDECENDCNLNGVPDDCDIDPTDPDGNGIVSADCDVANGNGAPDECEGDCNDNGVADSCDIARGTFNDLNGDGVPDECEEIVIPPGRCCVFGGACLNATEDECMALGGVYGGDFTSCAGDSDGDGDDDACPGTCCLDSNGDGHTDTCQGDTSGLDCTAAGGSFVEAGAACSGVTGACCLDWDGDDHHDLCVDGMAQECCLIQGGWFTPSGNCSGIIGACCLDVDGDGHHDTCTDDVDQDCCQVEGGWFTPNSTCSGIIGACCLDVDGDGAADSCTEIDVDCCVADGGTFLGVGSVCAGDGDGDGVDDTCSILPPMRASPPHNILKNRYISIDPRGANGDNPSNLHIRVMVDSSEVNGLLGSGPWWATDPVNGGGLSPAVCISVVTTTKPASEPDWSGCPTVHLTGCPIVPTTTYAIAAGFGSEFSVETLMDSQAKPGVKWHGDCVGFFDGAAWTDPNGSTNIDDAVAAIKTFQDPTAFNATHLSVTDMAPSLNGTQINLIVNIADVFTIILGFQGQEYPGPDLTKCP